MNYQLIFDFTAAPHLIYHGAEPARIEFYPPDYGININQKVEFISDLSKAKSGEDDGIASKIGLRVAAKNTSSGRIESLLGRLAKVIDGNKEFLFLFSYQEVSNGVYNLYLHKGISKQTGAVIRSPNTRPWAAPGNI